MLPVLKSLVNRLLLNFDASVSNHFYIWINVYILLHYNTPKQKM